MISVVGIGPGGGFDLTGRARAALARADAIVGYPVYTNLVRDEFPQAEIVTTPMRREEERCRAALAAAAEGRTVALVCSGDAGVYGMAGLVIELAAEYGIDARTIEVIPGVTAALGGAAVLGAPLICDFCTISLSDLLTPWDDIARRLRAAASADFAICLYNPSSHKRRDYLARAVAILLESKAPETVCGIVRAIGREGEHAQLTTLGELGSAEVDMSTTVFVGTSHTRVVDGRMVTPRGYRSERAAEQANGGAR